MLGWIEDRVSTSGLAVVGEGPPRLTTREAFEDFKNWATGEGYSPHCLPSVNTSSQRLQAAGPSRGIAYKQSGRFRGFVGLRLKPSRLAALVTKVDAA